MYLLKKRVQLDFWVGTEVLEKEKAILEVGIDCEFLEAGQTLSSFEMELFVRKVSEEFSNCIFMKNCENIPLQIKPKILGVEPTFENILKRIYEESCKFLEQLSKTCLVSFVTFHLPEREITYYP